MNLTDTRVEDLDFLHNNTRGKEFEDELCTRARTSLIDFCDWTYPNFVRGQHHIEIARLLDAVVDEQLNRVMINLPPRHGKSLLGSTRFPAYYVGRNPQKEIIHGSYGAGLAARFGREVRNLIGHPRYREVFPGVTLSEDSQAKDRWHTSQGGSYLATGVGGGITGWGAHLGLIDDPLRGRKDAQSETIRETIYDWYRGDFYTRLMGFGAVVLIQTRWHDADLGGKLIEEMNADGDQWTILKLKALPNDDDDPLGRPKYVEGMDLEEAKACALWPETYPTERLLQIRRQIGPRDWSSLYQQEPQDEEGDFFVRDWIRWYRTEDIEPMLEQWPRYGASDYATKDGEGDYTVHGVIAVDLALNWYIVDWWREQRESDLWIEQFLDMAERWKPLLWVEEAGVIRAGLGSQIRTRMRQRSVNCRREQLPSVMSKREHARATQAHMAAGKIYLPIDKPWSDDLAAELLRFDSGVYDDQVDVMGKFGRILERMSPASQLRNYNPERHIREVDELEIEMPETVWTMDTLAATIRKGHRVHVSSSAEYYGVVRSMIDDLARSWAGEGDTLANELAVSQLEILDNRHGEHVHE